MSTEVEIRGGGAVAVDTETLHHAAARFGGAAGRLEDLRSRLSHTQGLLYECRHYAGDAYGDAATAFQRLTVAIAEADRIAAALRDTAAVYELVELNALHHAAVLAGDGDGAARLDVQRDALLARHPAAMDAARGLEFERAVMWPSELVKVWTQMGWDSGRIVGPVGGTVGGVALGGAGILYAAAAGISRVGIIGRDARLSGGAVPVEVAARRVAATGAPLTLAAAASRVPTGDARVRVERYEMPDGSARFAVYVAGTTAGADEPFGFGSNLDLAQGRESASYSAVEKALAAAGAQPGDPVHAFGYSQGATVASYLAVQGDYDTQTLVTFGSPVSADVGPGTLSVAVRHTDDPIAVLAGGGHAMPVGAPGSFIAEAPVSPDKPLPDLPTSPHPLSSYAQTAARVDASHDPRVAGLHSVLAELRGAQSMTATEYTVSRGPDPALAPGAANRPPV